MAVGSRVLVLSPIKLQRSDITGRPANDNSQAVAGFCIDRVRRCCSRDSDTADGCTPGEEEREKSGYNHHGCCCDSTQVTTAEPKSTPSPSTLSLYVWKPIGQIFRLQNLLAHPRAHEIERSAEDKIKDKVGAL